MPRELTISVAGNSVALGSNKYRFRHRWEASALGIFWLLQAEDKASAVDSETLNRLLSTLGQSVPLHRKQLSLLFDSATTGLLAIGLITRLCDVESAPRKRTVGPWWWPGAGRNIAPDEITIRIIDAAGIESALEAQKTNRSLSASGAVSELAFAKDGTIATSRMIVWKCFFADAHAWDGSFMDVVESLKPDDIWNAATPAAQILRHMRLASAYRTLRNFKEATKHFRLAQDLAKSSPLLDAMFSQPIKTHLQRLRYNQNPASAAKQVEIAVTQQIDELTDVASKARQQSVIDPITLGHAFNLRALTRRRAIDALPADAAPARRDPLVSACICDGLSSLFCLLTTLELETTQNIASNIAYNLQRIALRGWLPAVDPIEKSNEVFDWYRLAFAWHYRFQLADNSIWEYIFLGEYWLANPEAMPSVRRDRTAQTDVALGVDWQSRHPSEAAFYEHALNRAEQIDDARQILLRCSQSPWFRQTSRQPIASAACTRCADQNIARLARYIEVGTGGRLQIPKIEHLS
jgi:hypothetical protein